MVRPIVFCSDYGLTDEFVGVCHGVISRIAPQARVIDLTHGIPAMNVSHGAAELGSSAKYMPEDAVYLAVTLDMCGYHEETRRFYLWCKRTQMGDGLWYQNHYTDGRRHWPGGGGPGSEGSSPYRDTLSGGALLARPRDFRAAGIAQHDISRP